jgi:phage terminase large subunit-like protein
MKNRVTAREIIDWIEDCCYVPEGKLVAKPVQLMAWQKHELRKIYDNRAGTRRAILSFGRKNGKTSLAAFLLLVHLCGPKAVPNSQLYSAAQSRDQAAVIFALAAKIVRISPALRSFVGIKDTAKELTCAELGTRYRALSAEVTTAFGLSPVFVVHDELGQVRGPRSALFEALETATAAQEDPLSIVISTQAPTDGDLLSILIDDAKAGNDPRTVLSLYTAPAEIDPFDVETIKLANPAFSGGWVNRGEILAMAEDAKRMPAREADYRNLILNQRVEASSPFITPGLWAACNAPVANLQGREVFCGLDLSEVADLTALVIVGKVDGIWHVEPTFWLPGDGLPEKSRNDRVPYDLWRSQGFLEATPGKTVSYDYVAHHLRRVFDLYRVQKIAFDAWNFRQLEPWLRTAGFSDQEIKERFVEFRQGAQSMSPALRALEETIRDKKLAHGGHPVLQMCLLGAVVESKDSSTRRLSKNKSTCRIDGAVALAMAFGVAPLGPKAFDVEALIA